jgi:hypothetical protein
VSHLARNHLDRCAPSTRNVITSLSKKRCATIGGNQHLCDRAALRQREYQHELEGHDHENLRALLLASAVGMSIVIPAAAQQAATTSPEAIEEAKKLIAIMSPDMIKDMNTKIFAQIWPSMEEQALRTQFSTLDAATADEIKAEMRTTLEKELNAEVATLMDTMPGVYARYLTAAEMRDIQAFYRTPAGAKALKVLPKIMGETMGSLGSRLQGMRQRINVAVLGILQKHGLGPK